VSIYRNVNTQTQTYELWYDSLDELTRERVSAVNRDHGDVGVTQFGSVQKFGVRTRAELDQLTRDGWEVGARRIAQLGRQLVAPKLKNVRRVRLRADFGDSLDIQRVYAGELDRAWDRTRRDIISSKVGNALTIAVNLSASWDYDADDLFWSGAAAVRLVDLLTQSGRSVRVLGYAGSYGIFEDSRVRHAHAVFVAKEYTDPADLAKLATVLAHAAFFRGYCWDAWCTIDARANGWLGSPINSAPPLIVEREAKNNVLDIQRVYCQTDAQALLGELIRKLT
jgi:hypothetical protein